MHTSFLGAWLRDPILQLEKWLILNRYISSVNTKVDEKSFVVSADTIDHLSLTIFFLFDSISSFTEVFKVAENTTCQSKSIAIYSKISFK